MNRRSLEGLIFAATLAFASPASGQTGAESSTDERDRSVMTRFLAVVEKAPRRGTALDRVYGYHVERGSLDAFLKTYQDRTASNPNDGAAWLIQGLIESQRGRDASAVAALRKAEAVRPDDPMPCYYLGQSLVLVGQPDDAAQAFERAIARKPNRADLLEIFQSLGRVYQRAHRNEQALAVWSRLEKLFPDDPRVQEQIAASLAEEAQPDQALPRYEALAKATKDRFRQVQFQIDAAELKVRLNRLPEALADFEGLLGKLDPESWLYREVRRKVEEIFTKSDDLAGLATYYEKWIKKTPDDVEAMSRLGKALTSQGRLGEARGWYEKAVGLAPTRRDLRSALIEQLLIEKKFVEAASQYEAIAKADPNNPDVLREWGRVILRDPARPVEERKKAASAIWRRLLEARPDDPSSLVAVADLLRSAEMNDEAIELYRSALARSPGSPQYAEYLGEFYHRLKRPQEAVATWSKIAEPPNRNARTLGRLAEVLSGFGYKAEALAASTEAASLDRDDFDLQLRLSDLLHASDKLEDERAQLDFARKAATGDEQREGVLERQIKNFQVSGLLGGRIEALRNELEAGTEATSERWRKLARYLEADQKPGESLISARKALAVEPGSIPTLVMVARLDEATGNLSGAADTFRRLAEVDRRARTEYLTGVARLEARLGRKDAALKAGRDLLAAAPGQLDNHQFFADLCLQLGQVDEGLDALRRAVRLNEADPKALLGLAETLAAQFRTEEAIEMFWRSFDKSPDLEARLSVVSRLTALYLQRNQFDRLIARLERQGREADRQREMSMCLAQAYSASGDFGTARGELERLLSTNPRDTKLLFQLSTLSESEGDPGTAAKYQKQLVDLAPGDEATSRLAQLYLQAGEVGEAEAIWTRLTANGEPDSARVLMAVDSLLGQGKKEAVLAITENLLRKRPENWEALYREGQALAALDRPLEAASRFRSILQLKANDDDLGAVARAKKKGMGRPGDPNNAQAPPTNVYAPTKSFPLQDRLTRVSQIRNASGIAGQFTTGSAWSPDDVGQARMACQGWLMSLAQKLGTSEAYVAEARQLAEKAPNDPRPHWNLYYLQVIREEFADTFEAAKGLAKAAPADPSAQFALMNTLPIRDRTTQTRLVNTGSTGPDTTTPLPDPELDLVLASYKTLKARKPDWAHAAILTAVADELKRSKRDQALKEFYDAAVEGSADADSVASILRVAAERGDVENVIKLHDRYERLVGTKTTASTNLYIYYGGYYSLASSPSDSIGRAMLIRLDAKAPGDVARLLDHYLIAARRPDRVTRRSRAIASPGVNRNNNRFQVWTGKTVKFSAITYPAPGHYFDLGSIQVLRNAFELYQRDDLVSDLVRHLKESLEAGSDVDKTYTHLALCYLQWWNDDKDEALAELTEATRTSKSDPELLLELAELRAQRNEPEEALRVADSFEPLDQKAMQRRELLAIRLAVVIGDVPRARKAAERLFGLRLDADTQVQLASQMHQLGMHELAEAVLGRARRRAGGNLGALVSLMLQYQRQGKAEVAVQVANQVLRRNPARANPGYYDEGEEARIEAVQVLARSGKIQEMIGRLEEQVKRTPGSPQLHQRLADYYKAAGDKAKAKLEYEELVRLRPDDTRLRFQIAGELVRADDAASAIDHYKAALRKEPTLLGSGYYTIQQAFQQAGRLDELFQIVEGADIRSFGSIYYIARIIQSILQDKAKQDRGLALFAKAWKASPTQHDALLLYINNEEIWQLPVMYDYLRESAIPAEGRKSVPPWLGVGDTLRSSSNGRMTTVAGRLVDVAERRGKLEALTEEVARAEKRVPHWRGGPALRGLILARRGRLDEARDLLSPLADPKLADPVPSYVRQVIGQEWESIPALRPLALTLYESAMKDFDQADMLFYNSPIQRLVEMYRSAGRLDDARRELIALSRKTVTSQYEPSGNAYWKINDRTEVAAKLVAIGFPADAARIYDETLADKDTIELAKDWSGEEDYQANRLRQGLESALEALEADNLAATLKAQLAAPAPPDLLLLITPRDLESATISSLLEASIRSAARTPGGLGEVRASLAKRVEAQPGDIPTRVALALATFEGGSPESTGSAVLELAKLVESSPLEALGPDDRANARQRLEAARQLGLWLVAREARRRPELRDAARALTERSIEAARRQLDPAWSLAMLRELGQESLDRGDREEAEATWSRMLRSILVASSTSKAEPGKKAVVPVATLDRFEQAMKLARMAADRGLVPFSLRAALEPLRGGPPVVPLTIRSSTNGVSRNPMDKVKEQAIDRAVEARLSELEAAWEAGHVSPVAIYELLREVVLPESRPSEVFAYPRPFGEGGMERPRSVAGMLVQYAIRADRVADLRRRLDGRAGQATAEAPSRSILVQVDLARRDFEGANRGLQALLALLSKDKLPATAELTCLASLPALAIPETEAAALPVLEAASVTFASTGSEGASVKVLTALGHRHFEAKRAEEGRKRVRATLEALERATAAGQSAYRNYGNAFQSRRENLQVVALEYARAGQWDEAMEALGQAADSPISINGARAGTPIALFAVARHLATLPPSDRYEKLRAWTMPGETRSTIRSFAAFAPTEVPPESFGRFPAIGDGSGLVATWELLVRAAKDAGKLGELATEARRAVEKKCEHAETLLALVEIARGRAAEVEPMLKARLVEWSRKPDEVVTTVGPTPPRPAPWSDHLLARAAMAEPKLAGLGRKLAETPKWKQVDLDLQGHLRLDRVASFLPAGEGPGPGLACWTPSGGATAASTRQGASPGRWIAQSGHIHHKASSPVMGTDAQATEHPARPESLVFRVPLGGRFRFEVVASGLGAEVGYGGLMMSGYADGVSRVNSSRMTPEPRLGGKVRPIGADESTPRPALTAPGAESTLLTIAVEPGSVRFLANGHLVYEDRETNPGSPWLVLGASGEGDVDFRDLRLTGQPTIPREIPLTRADRLDGWLSDFYAESRPRRPLAPDGRPEAPLSRPASSPSVDKDWSALDGLIVGRRDPSKEGDAPSQSRLAYHRPLEAGEAITYEFFHEPDVATVHPALGRLAFLLEPSGVRLHWMTDGPEVDASGVLASNAIDEPSSRRGPATLPLRPGEWNRAKVTLVGRSVEVELNGVKVFERDLEPTNDRLFAFYHDKARTTSKVREVVLRGAWPETLPPADLAKRHDDGVVESRRARAAAIGEVAFARDAGAVLEASKALPPDRRYETLLAWVLPGDDHASFRLGGEFTPTDPPSSSPVPVPPGLARVQVGGTWNVPALALVAAAVEAKRLEDLAGRVEAAGTSTELDERGKLAMLALVRLEQGRDDEARVALQALKPRLEAVSPDAAEAERWPELVAVAGSLSRPAVRDAARALMDVLILGQIRKDHKAIGETWKLHAFQLAGLLEKPQPSLPTMSLDLNRAGWSSVTHSRASSRGTGAPPPSWEVEDRTLTHGSGFDRDFAYARTPIRGDFEASAEVPAGRAALHLAYGGVAVGIAPDGKEVVITPFGKPSRRVALDPPLLPAQDPRQVRLTVQSGTLSAFVDARKVFEQGLPASPDPWLALAMPADESGSLRNLKLGGSITVPDRIALSDQPDLLGWLPGDEVPPAVEVDPTWQKRGDEVFGRAFADSRGSKQEAWLRYHRPMLEDGEITYEFFHEPGRSTVAPALGRLAFVLASDGVKLHRITDAPYDRTGLAPENLEDEKAARRGPAELPIRPGAWNRMALAVVGDRVVLKLNDVVVYDRAIEPVNQRAFGLFHYADEGEARVRDVSYRGDWPRRTTIDLGFEPAKK